MQQGVSLLQECQDGFVLECSVKRDTVGEPEVLDRLPDAVAVSVGSCPGRGLAPDEVEDDRHALGGDARHRLKRVLPSLPPGEPADPDDAEDAVEAAALSRRTKAGAVDGRPDHSRLREAGAVCKSLLFRGFRDAVNRVGTPESGRIARRQEPRRRRVRIDLEIAAAHADY
jgi:hypothetical protein